MSQNQEMPKLTLTPFAQEEAPKEGPAQENQASAPDESMLTEQERQMVEEFAKQIDVTNANMVLNYGAQSQKQMADFSENALENVRTKDMGEVGGMVTDLIGELKNFDAQEEAKGIFGMFKKGKNRLEMLNARYNKVEKNVDVIVDNLRSHQVVLFKDIAVLDKLYERNQLNFKELTMYILAGKKRLNQLRETELKALMEKAQRTGLAEDAQAANDFAGLCDRFEKKLHDLELTRMVSIQMGPQIRLVQNNNTLMAEKIQSTIVNTIPLWKNQMVLALGIEHSNQAMRAQREVTNMTNELLKKNADTLKMGTIETARESERGVVDMETLRYTNEQLISTLDEVMQIQEEGRAKRRAAESELRGIENQLKEKLLTIKI